MVKSTPVAVTAIICLAVIEIVALSRGINGLILSGVCIGISGIAGFVVPSPFQKNK